MTHQNRHQSGDAFSLQLRAVARRLESPLKQRSTQKFSELFQSQLNRYGKAVLETYIERLCPLDRFWVSSIVEELLDPAQRDRINAEACKGVALQIDRLGVGSIRLGFDFKVSDQGFMVSPEAKKVLCEDGNPIAPLFPATPREIIAQSGLERPFYHPLSEAYPEIKQQNTWLFASQIINTVHSWYELGEPQGRASDAMKLIRELVPLAAPTADPEELVFRSSYDDRELLRLCQFLNQALELKIDRAVGLG